MNVSAFGETTDGREFRLVVPEFTFNVETVYEPLDNNEKNNTLKNPENKVQYNIKDSTRNIANIAKVNEMITITEQETAATLLIKKQLEDEKDQENLVIIITSNLIILMVSIMLFFSFRRKNTKYK